MASSRAHLRLDSWWPRPSQESQCFPGQSILSPQYKYFSLPVRILFRGVQLLDLRTISRVLKEGSDNPLVEMREGRRNKSAMAARTSKSIADLSLDLDFGVLWIAIGVAERLSKEARVN